MKTAVKVDLVKLRQCIATVESAGPLVNRNSLYQAVSLAYADPKVTPSVVMLRIMNEHIPVITPVGKRGRVKGQKIGPVNRTKRADKIDPKHIQALRASFPKKYHNIVNRIAAGSVKAMCKGMCLSCVGFERMQKEDDDPKSRAVDQIGNCTVITCPIWNIRPYQKG